MKLRIKGNSLRLRLTRSEVSDFARTGICAETAFFGPKGDDRLAYSVERTDDNNISASFGDRVLTIYVPGSIADDWPTSDTVGIEDTVSIGANGELHVLIEKDFVCLTRDDEDPSEHYPHPNPNACR